MIRDGVCCVCNRGDNVLCVSEEDEKKKLIVNILQFCHLWKHPGPESVVVCYECVKQLEVCHRLMQDHIQQRRETRNSSENGTAQMMGAESDGEQLVIDEERSSPDEPGPPTGKSSNCEYCGKLFFHRGDLNKHRRTHTGEQPYTCTECGRRFSHTSNLLRHRKIHSGETPFGCPVCGKRYSRKDKLAGHMRSTHGEVRQDR